MSKDDTRATLTIALWFFSAAALVGLFISAAAQGDLTAGHMLLAFTILALAIAGTPYLLRWKDNEAEAKAKRRRIDSLLHDLSDEDLIELKQRLSGEDFSVETLAALSDDGEKALRH